MIKFVHNLYEVHGGLYVWVGRTSIPGDALKFVSKHAGTAVVPFIKTTKRVINV